MEILLEEFVNQQLNTTPFKDLRMGAVYTLYERAGGLYYKYDFLALSIIDTEEITLVDTSDGEEFCRKAASDFQDYGRAWFLV